MLLYLPLSFLDLQQIRNSLLKVSLELLQCLFSSFLISFKALIEAYNIGYYSLSKSLERKQEKRKVLIGRGYQNTIIRIFYISILIIIGKTLYYYIMLLRLSAKIPRIQYIQISAIEIKISKKGITFIMFLLKKLILTRYSQLQAEKIIKRKGEGKNIYRLAIR